MSHAMFNWGASDLAGRQSRVGEQPDEHRETRASFTMFASRLTNAETTAVGLRRLYCDTVISFRGGSTKCS